MIDGTAPRASDNAIALSVLIPNYNYARYIGETLDSVILQAGPDVEIAVSDNASSDDSVSVVRARGFSNLRLSVNACNVGFSGNLERVASLARGRRMLLLSSDDRMRPGAIDAYRRLENALGLSASRAIWGAATTIIDSHGAQTGRVGPDPKLWRDAPVDPVLSAAVGLPVRTMSAARMLARSLALMRTPLPFATTCYPAQLHDAIGGYVGGRLINPDKWFLWKLLGEAETILMIDHELFDYRVHGAGQGAQEKRLGALKHLTDEYVATFDLPDAVLAKAGLDRERLAAAFVEQDIVLRGLLAVADGKRTLARRGLHFGTATYPDLVRGNRKTWLLRALIALGPLGTVLARAARGGALARWQRDHESGERPYVAPES